MSISGKEALKEILGEIPLTAEFYWLVRQRGRAFSRFSLKHLQANLPQIRDQAAQFAQSASVGKKVFIFATLHYWIEQATMLGMALAGQGHHVTLGFLPYSEWQKPISRFDLRRQNLYARRVLALGEPLIKPVSLLEGRGQYTPLPKELATAVEQVSAYDAQYTLQVEVFDVRSPIYQLRLERNTAIAQAALTWFHANRPDVVIIPNGSIQEFGVVYRVARYMKVPVVTYEFGDQRDRIWVAKNSEVMRQETGTMWEARKETPLSDAQMERIRAMFAARQKASTWENFARRWQGVPAQGGEQARAALGLDQRPVALLATNVLGDSLTLGRQVFSQTMAEWIARTVQYFSGCPDTQLVVRVHPGELLTHGPSMMTVVHEVLPHLPEHIHLIGPKEKINTYDLIDVADLGLVYTTTVGLEMAMDGLPVIVAGQTHYRGRGFTLDPESWVSYFKTLGQALAKPDVFRLSRQQMELAWQYAYRFFFEFPHPFPWHLVHMWEDVQAQPLSVVLSPQGMQKYGRTFAYLTGEPVDWTKMGE
ncbi:MAG: hypothetical protein PHQ40_05195 [Anaerolineaceae bacterium]|nr:hypothetical protein [Anaerolineaceae bacterium]